MPISINDWETYVTKMVKAKHPLANQLIKTINATMIKPIITNDRHQKIVNQNLAVTKISTRFWEIIEQQVILVPRNQQKEYQRIIRASHDNQAIRIQIIDRIQQLVKSDHYLSFEKYLKQYDANLTTGIPEANLFNLINLFENEILQLRHIEAVTGGE